VLADVSWPTGDGQTVYVTENPSVLSAATDVVAARVVCTSGTPSRTGITALAHLAASHWDLHVRADFDDAGLGNVAAAGRLPATPWDPQLAETMAARGLAVFEESYMDQLVDDIATATA
jgi:hypothetical protein